MNRIPDVRRMAVGLICSCAIFANASNRNWSAGANAQWTNSSTWTEGVVPIAEDDVSLNLNSTITIGNGVAAVANTVVLSNAVGNQLLAIEAGGSLAVGGAITDLGAGIADIRVSNASEANAANVLTAASLACREFSIPSDPANPQYLTTGYDMTLASWINVNYGAPVYGNTFRQTNGTITIPNSGYGIVLMDATAKPAAGAFGRYILDGGTLKSDRIGVADGNGNNSASLDRYAGTGIFEFNNGTVQTRTTGDAVWFQNGFALENYPGSGTRDTQFNTSKPTTVQLAQSGTHTFYADGSGNKIYISPSAQLVDKPGEAGTLVKAGSGDLLFTGGGLAATNSWTGDTTVTAGRIQVDYGQVAGAPGSLALNNAYSPRSKLILNGGGFDLTGRANATNSVFSDCTFAAGTLSLTVGSTAGLVVGQAVSNAFLPAGSYIRRITGGTQVQLNAMSTSTSQQTGQTFTFGAADFTSEQTVSNVELQATFSPVTVNPAGTSTLLTFVNVSGPGGLTKYGWGSLRMTGAVTFDGKINISTGVLDFAGSSNVTLTNAIIGTSAGTFRKTGTGTNTVVSAASSINTFSGAVVVDAGVLVQGVGTANQRRGFTSAASFTVNSGALLIVARDAVNDSAVYNLNGGTMKKSDGYQTLGPVFLNGGTIITGPGSGFPYQAYAFSGDVTVTGTTASVIVAGSGSNNGIHLTYNQPADGTMRTFRVEDATGSAAADLTVGANLAESSHLTKRAGLIKTGAGTMTLSALNNTYSGATIVSNGTLLVSGGGITGSVVTVVSGASFGAAATNLAKVAGLTLNAGAKLVWSYDGAAHQAGRIAVAGTLTLPAVATLEVGGTGFLYSGQTLISAAATAGATDLSGWTLNGTPANSHLVLDGTTVKLIVNRGTLLRML